jgi:hypothetical protein
MLSDAKDKEEALKKELTKTKDYVRILKERTEEVHDGMYCLS